MKIQIKARFTNSILFEGEYESKRHGVEQAVKSSADLCSANLSSADLSFADLCSANLSFADLSFANLSFANLRYANLRYADLRSADLCSANLSSADLRYANLRSAELHDNNNKLVDVIITHAQMSGIDGSGRQITIIFGEKSDWIIAGCFFGTVKEFCAKAKSEDKLIYVKIVGDFVKLKRKKLDKGN
jgi:uncharacterized protein YjbI with pentapeptide repeats